MLGLLQKKLYGNLTTLEQAVVFKTRSLVSFNLYNTRPLLLWNHLGKGKHYKTWSDYKSH